MAGGAALFGARFYTAEETPPARYVEGYDLSAAAIQKAGPEGVSLTEQDAHAWAEVYFDGIGWPAGCPTSSPGTIAARRPCWKKVLCGGEMMQIFAVFAGKALEFSAHLCYHDTSTAKGVLAQRRGSQAPGPGKHTAAAGFTKI